MAGGRVVEALELACLQSQELVDRIIEEAIGAYYPLLFDSHPRSCYTHYHNHKSSRRLDAARHSQSKY